MRPFNKLLKIYLPSFIIALPDLAPISVLGLALAEGKKDIGLAPAFCVTTSVKEPGVP